MKEFIDRGALLKDIEESVVLSVRNAPSAEMRGANKIMERIKCAPTIDAVVVVRCKDCVQWDRHCGIVDSPNGHCWTHDIEMNGCDFCSYGERKDGEG